MYIVEEAVEFVADYLPAESQARLTHEEVRLLIAHMRWLRRRASSRRSPSTTSRTSPTPGRRRGHHRRRLPHRRAERAGLRLDDVDVAHIVEAHLAYFEAIGAVGPPARLEE